MAGLLDPRTRLGLVSLTVSDLGRSIDFYTERLGLILIGREAGEADFDPATPAGGTVMGHVHLHVSRLEAASRFYLETLGFELTQRYGNQALFVSAGGYHHHVGLNTWQGVGAPPPPPHSTGLRHFEIELAGGAEKIAARGRLEAAGVPVEYVDGGENIFFRDPAGNGVVLAS